MFSYAKALIRTFTQSKSSSHSIASLRPSFRPKLLVSVAGHDNKASQTTRQNRLTPYCDWIFGDDACFVSFESEDCVLGVADGVGGWRHYNIDPGHFSRAIVSTCQSLVENGQYDITRPINLIQSVYNEILHQKSPILGSATFCVLTLSSSQRRVYAASLGDSGFLILRNGEVIKRSALQKHDFNTPFQLACLPPTNTGVQFHHDPPENASHTEFDVEIGDLLVVGTDGLFDNLTDAMIIRELDQSSSKACTHQEHWLHDCAQRLVDRAKEVAQSETFLSPFASEARQYGINIVGGVPGDVTVILGLVVEQSQSSS